MVLGISLGDRGRCILARVCLARKERFAYVSTAAGLGRKPMTVPLTLSPSDSNGEGTFKSATPAEMVKHLDDHVIGHSEAKKTVANALRNRWRRLQLTDPELRHDICPHNILMVGPTGVGKTELARKLSTLLEAPFLKVEATKFTEVGFHGLDVDQIIHDLVNVSIKLESLRVEKFARDLAMRKADEIIVEKIFGRKLTSAEMEKGVQDLRTGHFDRFIASYTESETDTQRPSGRAGNNGAGYPRISMATQEEYGEYGRQRPSSRFDGGLAFEHNGPSRVSLPQSSTGSVPNGEAENREAIRKATLQEARNKLILSETSCLSNEENIVKRAITSAEQEGIVFIDEIDKICVSQAGDGGPFQGSFDVSSVGVQRDLLPLIEGCTITTKHGPVKTDHILFIAAGAFHSAKPSDLLPELQGRLPVRVVLSRLSRNDLYRILTEPKRSLIQQKTALLQTEGVRLLFTEKAKWAIANVAEKINREVENIGARRLHTILEKLLEDVSFDAPSLRQTDVTITDQMVAQVTEDLTKKVDYRKFIL